MEKFENMQQNRINDDELDQISGGRNLFDIFTADFRGKVKDPTTLEMNLEDEKANIKLTTLEMRENPLKKEKDSKKVVKL